MKPSENLKPYFTLGLPLVPLMTLLAIAGIVLTVLINYFF